MAMDRKSTRLHQIIHRQIDDYQANDNPEPKTKWESFTRLFESSGSSGRKCAKTLRFIINQITDEQELKEKLLDETLSKNGLLASSTLLRRRVLKGLCQFFNMNMVNLAQQAKENMLKYNALMAETGSTHTLEDELEPLMVSKIKLRTKWIENKYDKDSEIKGAMELHTISRR